MKITELPLGELAIWKNKKGTYFLFYLYQNRPGELWMKVVWSSSGNKGNDFSVSPVDNEWICEPLGIALIRG